MNEFFEIYGNPIRYDSIKDFRIVEKEYIYVPSYIEEIVEERDGGVRGILGKKNKVTRFMFDRMVPYAAICDETDRRGVLGKIEPVNFAQAVGKELIGDLRESVGNKFNIKLIKGKKYKCYNQAGRKFDVYLDEIPLKIIRSDGLMYEIEKDSEDYSRFNDSHTPTILFVPVLVIEADRNYVFWGNGIQIDDIGAEYQRLKLELSRHEAEKHKTGQLLEEAKIAQIEEKKNSRKFKMPLLGKREKETVDNE